MSPLWRRSLFARAGVLSATRAMVSGNRTRYVDEEFDLDLTYVTERVIAMAFPGEDAIGQYSVLIRNNLRTVKRFLDKRHPGRYCVFNLCQEKRYAAAKFDGNVVEVPMLDHHPPTLAQLKFFCHALSKWLLQHPDNVAAVHCKGGKGRTGVMICAFLLMQGWADDKRIETPREAVDHFADRRTADPAGPRQGVSGISQMRYIDLFHRARLAGRVALRVLRLTRIRIVRIPALAAAERNGVKYFVPILRVTSRGHTEVFRAARHRSTLARWCRCFGDGADARGELELEAGSDQVAQVFTQPGPAHPSSFSDGPGLLVSEDVRVELFNGEQSGGTAEADSDLSVCFACFHTSEVRASPHVFEQREIDKAAKDLPRGKLFPRGFRLELFFNAAEEPGAPSPSLSPVHQGHLEASNLPWQASPRRLSAWVNGLASPNRQRSASAALLGRPPQQLRACHLDSLVPNSLEVSQGVFVHRAPQGVGTSVKDTMPDPALEAPRDADGAQHRSPEEVSPGGPEGAAVVNGSSADPAARKHATPSPLASSEAHERASGASSRRRSSFRQRIGAALEPLNLKRLSVVSLSPASAQQSPLRRGSTLSPESAEQSPSVTARLRRGSKLMLGLRRLSLSLWSTASGESLGGRECEPEAPPVVFPEDVLLAFYRAAADATLPIRVPRGEVLAQHGRDLFSLVLVARGTLRRTAPDLERFPLRRATRVGAYETACEASVLLYGRPAAPGEPGACRQVGALVAQEDASVLLLSPAALAATPGFVRDRPLLYHGLFLHLRAKLLEALHALHALLDERGAWDGGGGGNRAARRALLRELEVPVFERELLALTAASSRAPRPVQAGATAPRASPCGSADAAEADQAGQARGLGQAVAALRRQFWRGERDAPDAAVVPKSTTPRAQSEVLLLPSCLIVQDAGRRGAARRPLRMELRHVHVVHVDGARVVVGAAAGVGRRERWCTLQYAGAAEAQVAAEALRAQVALLAAEASAPQRREGAASAAGAAAAAPGRGEPLRRPGSPRAGAASSPEAFSRAASDASAFSRGSSAGSLTRKHRRALDEEEVRRMAAEDDAERERTLPELFGRSAGLAKVQRVGPGQPIQSLQAATGLGGAESAPRFCLVLRGSVVLRVRGGGGAAHKGIPGWVVAALGPGSTFGELPLLGGHAWDAPPPGACFAAARYGEAVVLASVSGAALEAVAASAPVATRVRLFRHLAESCARMMRAWEQPGSADEETAQGAAGAAPGSATGSGSVSGSGSGSQTQVAAGSSHSDHSVPEVQAPALSPLVAGAGRPRWRKLTTDSES